MLVASVAIVALLLTAASCDDKQILLYKSSAKKGLKSATMRELGPDYIPDKQCSGLISQLSCPPLVMMALEVVVLDREQYAEVLIDNSLATAKVFRRPNAVSGQCEGEALVRVSLSCGGYRRLLGGRQRRYGRSALYPRANHTKLPLPPVN